MPEEARTKREDPDEPLWGWNEELLAQVIEEVSVLAADRRRKEPRKLRRPFEPDPEKSGGLVENASGGVSAHGHDAMLAMFRARVGRSLPPTPAAAEDVQDESTAGDDTTPEVSGG